MYVCMLRLAPVGLVVRLEHIVDVYWIKRCIMMDEKEVWLASHFSCPQMFLSKTSEGKTDGNQL